MTYPQPNYGQSPYGPGPYWPAPVPQDAKNGLGMAAMVLGILALLFGLIPILFVVSYVLGPLAVIFGIIGISRASRRLATNRTAAVAGLVLGTLGLIAAIIWTAVLASTGGTTSESSGRITVANASGSGNRTPGSLPIGQTVTATYRDTTIQITVLKEQIRGTDFGILVDYVCSTGSCSYSAADWNVQDNDGTFHDRTVGGSFGQPLDSGELKPGDKAQGWVSFYGPEGVDTAVYGTKIFSTYATWNLPRS